MGDFAEVPSKKKLKAAFFEYSDGSDTLTPEQFKSLCYKFYLSPTNKGISDLFKELDKNSDSLLTFEEVHSLIDKQWTPINDRKQTFLQDLKNCRKKSGPIDREELKEILQQGSDEALTDEDIDFCFEKMDLNGDAQISEEEIAELIFQFDEVLSRAPSRVEQKRKGSDSKDRKRSSSGSRERKHSGERKHHDSGSKEKERKDSESKERKRSRSGSREKERKGSGSKERKRSRSGSKDRKGSDSESKERHRSGSGDRKRKGSAKRKGSGDSSRNGSGKGSGKDKHKEKMMNGDTHEDEDIVDELFGETIEKPLGMKQKKPKDDEDEEENDDVVQDEEDNEQEATEDTEEESEEKEKSKKDKVKKDGDKKKAKEISQEKEDEED